MRIAFRLLLLSSASLLSVSAPLAADDAKSLFQTHFAGVAGGTPCYAHSYSAEHLKAHEAQRVIRIELDMAKETPDGKPITEETMELGFGVQVRDTPRWYTNVAVCKSAGASINCFLESDGGNFTLTAAGGGGLRLETGETGLAIEGDDFLELPHDQGDDAVFVLEPADHSACAAATAGVTE